MKYALSLGDNDYVRAVAWFSETLPIITLRTDNIEKAKLFDDTNTEAIFQRNYPKAKFVPVKIDNA
ncbi:hypothetical protein ABE402_05870 [Bacillus smithii]|uniref:hypothetical protein n=1 Tax=Bacillus smithii TaxID=1479 RepID=UPI003D19F5F3